MHTFQGGYGITFHHNGDFSGDVIVNKADGSTMMIPFEAMKNLVVEYIRQCYIATIEYATPDELLALLAGIGKDT